jgi:hypothetical protein
LASEKVFSLTLENGMLQKIMFWRKRRGKVSTTMVDASISTGATSKCDVGTNTEDMVVEGELNSYQAPPPAEYAEGCDPLAQFSQQLYGYTIVWILHTTRNRMGPIVYTSSVYAYSLPAYPPECSQVTSL